MRRAFPVTCLVSSLWVAFATASFAQPPQTARDASSETLRLGLDDAVRMALEHNVDLAAERLDPRIGDTRVAAAAGAFRPTFSTSVLRENHVDPPASFLVPVATRNDAVTSELGLTQRLPWFGTSYSLSWNAAHTDSNSFLTSYNPILQSGLLLSVSQPLVRDFRIDSARQELATSRVERDIADARLREALVSTTAAVKSTYWNLVSAIASVDARKSALDLAEELVRVNSTKVDVGEAPPLDLVAAQAEAAADREQVIIAETTVKSVEDRLRMLIFDTSDRRAWNITLDPVDAPTLRVTLPDLDLAVTNALHDRTDLARSRKDIARARVDVDFTSNQRLPDVRVNARYLASGLGGTQLMRTGGFPGTIVGPGQDTGFGSVLDQLFTGRYSTWAVGLSVNYPLGRAAEEADHARAKLEQTRAEAQLKSAEARAVQEVRDAWRQIQMNARRMETTRAARELADQRLDAERARFQVGMSTSFLVIQAQRDLTQAKTSELAATLAYALAVVDFESVQQAPASAPAASNPASPASPSAAATPGNAGSADRP